MASELVRASLELAWSHWVALGVSGTARPPDTAVDPEALLYFTSMLVDDDARLGAEVRDWHAQFGHRLSQARLSALDNRFEMTSVVNLLAALTIGGKTSGKSRLDHLATPARSMLRFRCVFGANARAEIMLELLGRNDRVTALELSELGYSKRNIALVLEELVLANVVEKAAEANRTRYRIRDATTLRAAFGPVPESSGQWHIRLPIASAFLGLAKRIEKKSAMVQSVEAQKLLVKQQPKLELLQAPPMSLAIAENFWATLQRWLVDHVLVGPTRSRSIAGMIEGSWVREGLPIQRPPSFGSAVLPAPTKTRGGTMTCLDLVQVPTVTPRDDWAWAVLSTAATDVYAHTSGLDRDEAWNFVTWVDGTPHIYRAEYDKALAPEKIAAMYGEEAASRARKDQPAVQLKLTWQR